ncbi:hypothetical protein [Ichthyenterobacterium magnum]|uniref:DUF1574 domain-containing protein n=1 Tax=Ichthyenterobacterium magnum TaxID=1230530 RepID=A0A420DUM9_9FLAO|nr:hypothetical protein [Ichthyenterobacterium magnum]RKE97976.1 hypothetical protein BXY80_0041 [Ichthyenterobacterium magnum]
MKAFLKHIGLLSIVIVVLLCVLDLAYTWVYEHSDPRNKTQFILSLKESDTLDYVFLGSSRVENTIVTSKIKALTDKTVLNLGTQGAKLDDVNIFLQLLLSRNIKINKVFIQVDYLFNFESSSDIVRSQSLPFIRKHSIIKTYLQKTDSSFNLNYYLPFYRYAKNDYRVGFREFVASSINRKAVVNFNDGFLPLYGKMKSSSISTLPKTILKQNKSFDIIDSICRKNKIDVIYFCAPFCQNLKNRDYVDSLKIRIPNFKDFSEVVTNNALFQNCSHLNEEGANYFTELLIKELKL